MLINNEEILTKFGDYKTKVELTKDLHLLEHFFPEETIIEINSKTGGSRPDKRGPEFSAPLAGFFIIKTLPEGLRILDRAFLVENPQFYYIFEP